MRTRSRPRRRGRPRLRLLPAWISVALGWGLAAPPLVAAPRSGGPLARELASDLMRRGADPAALVQLAGAPLSGGRVRGQAQLILERAAAGDTPVLSLSVARGHGAADGPPLRLLLDTGASSTMITPEAAARLGLRSEPLPPEAFALAAGGSGCAALAPRRARLPDLILGGVGPDDGHLLLQGVEALVLPVAALPTGVDGVLGAPSLRRLPFLIDPATSRLLLGPVAIDAFMASPPRPPGLATTARRMPLRVPLQWRHGVPVVRLMSAGAPVEALADTGAEGLFVSPSLAARLEPAGLAQPLRLVGVCGEQQVQRLRFRGLALPGAISGRGGGPALGGGVGMPSRDVGPEVEGIVTDNPVFAGLAVEAIAGQEWLRHRLQLWRLDQDPPLLLLR